MADVSTCPPLTRESVKAAHKQIQPYVHHTPIATCQTLDHLASTPISQRDPDTLPREEKSGCPLVVPESNPQIRFFFKCENLQKIGAFKARGAFHALIRLIASPQDGALQTATTATYPSADAALRPGGRTTTATDPASPSSSPPPPPGLASLRRTGVMTHSSGNHAQALALAAATFGVPAHIVMPAISTPSKIAGTRSHGAHVYFSGSTSEEREAVVREVSARTGGAVLIPPYDHPDIILGQGTLALEAEAGVEAMLVGGEEGARGAKKGLDVMIAPIGGGGMLSGVCTALEGTGIDVYGAEPSFEGANDAEMGLRDGKRVESVSTLTIADGLRTPVGLWPWKVISDETKLKGIFSVTEEEIKAALRLLMERAKLFVEPSAAVPLAVALFNEAFRSKIEKEAQGRTINLGVVLGGGNTTVDAIAKLFEQPHDGAERAEGTLGMDGEKKAENVAG